MAGCSGEPAGAPSHAGKKTADEISGPYPKTIKGTIGYSFPLEDGSGNIKLGLLAYDRVAIIVSTETYDAKGMEADDAEVTLTIEPTASKHCDKDEQCFKGY